MSYIHRQKELPDISGSSVIYRMFKQPDLPLRDVEKFAIVVELITNDIFLNLYIRRSGLSDRSTVHVRQALVTSGSLTRKILSSFQLNDIEAEVIDNLNRLLSCCSVVSNRLDRYIFDPDTIDSLLDRVGSSHITSVKQSISLVLALANQISYSASELHIPHIRLIDKTFPYIKRIEVFRNDGFNLTVSNNILVEDRWYALFRGLIFKDDPERIKNQLIQFCTTINIGTLPDIKSGNGLTKYLYEAYASSKITRQYIEDHDVIISDLGKIVQALSYKSLNTIDYAHIVGSLEAQTSDTSDPDEDTDLEADADTAEDEGGDDNESSESPTTTEDQDAPDKSDDDTSDADVSDEEPTADTPTNLDDDNPSEDGLDNTDTPDRPVLFGLNLTLPKNETLDDFMYKVSIARFIDNVIEYNRDEFPMETVTLLKRWKSSMLFLTDATETQRLLKDLKIKVK